jgi:hypothetical protein
MDFCMVLFPAADSRAWLFLRCPLLLRALRSSAVKTLDSHHGEAKSAEEDNLKVKNRQAYASRSESINPVMLL